MEYYHDVSMMGLWVCDVWMCVICVVLCVCQVLGQQVSDDHVPDVCLIGEMGDVNELGRLLQLVLGCAVSCEHKQGELETAEQEKRCAFLFCNLSFTCWCLILVSRTHSADHDSRGICSTCGHDGHTGGKPHTITEHCNDVMSLLLWFTEEALERCLFVSQLLTKEHVEAGTPETYGDFDYQVCMEYRLLLCCCLFSVCSLLSLLSVSITQSRKYYFLSEETDDRDDSSQRRRELEQQVRERWKSYFSLL